MKAIVVTESGGPEVLHIQEVLEPELKDDEVLIRVKVTVVNRSDVIERKKFIPWHQCQSLHLGLECSGIIEKVGRHVKNWEVNTEVCAVLSGMGYAEKVAVPAAHVFNKPKNLSFRDAAALPYAACTVWAELFTFTRDLSPTFWLPEGRTRLCADEKLLVHEDSNGIGTFAVQFASSKRVSACIISSNRSYPDHCQKFVSGEFVSLEDFIQKGNRGVDVILDMSQSPNFLQSISCLKIGGKLVNLGNLIFNTVDTRNYLPNRVDTNDPKRIYIGAAAFQHRTPEARGVIIAEVTKNVWPYIECDQVKASYHTQVFPFSEGQLQEAHRLMESDQHIQKILIDLDN